MLGFVYSPRDYVIIANCYAMNANFTLFITRNFIKYLLEFLFIKSILKFPFTIFNITSCMYNVHCTLFTVQCTVNNVHLFSYIIINLEFVLIPLICLTIQFLLVFDVIRNIREYT